MKRTWTIVATLTALTAGTGCWSTYDYDGRLVYNYCEYDTVSQAQFEGCLEHVTADEIRDRDTEAARAARELTDAEAEDFAP